MAFFQTFKDLGLVSTWQEFSKWFRKLKVIPEVERTISVVRVFRPLGVGFVNSLSPSHLLCCEDLVALAWGAAAGGVPVHGPLLLEVGERRVSASLPLPGCASCEVSGPAKVVSSAGGS